MCAYGSRVFVRTGQTIDLEYSMIVDVGNECVHLASRDENAEVRSVACPNFDLKRVRFFKSEFHRCVAFTVLLSPRSLCLNSGLLQKICTITH